MCLLMNEEDADRKLYPVLAVCVCACARACAQEGQGLPASDSGAQGAARSLQLLGVRHSEKAGGWQTGTSGRVTKSHPGREIKTKPFMALQNRLPYMVLLWAPLCPWE